MTADVTDVAALPDVAQRGGDPEFLRRELMWVIEHAIAAHPRSRQRRLGPSELGMPCARRLGYRLLGVEPVNGQDRVPWKPTIGTAVHTWLDGALALANRQVSTPEAGPRFLLEHQVEVGAILGEPISGRCDVYDRITATVVDFKVVGADQLRAYRTGGPGEQYRIQTHLYGRGWVRRGLPVDVVAVLFLPRDRELDKAVWWHEPYDESTAVKALTRVEGITRLVRDAGRAALPLLPTADALCRFCPYFLPAATQLGQACPGHPKPARPNKPGPRTARA